MSTEGHSQNAPFLKAVVLLCLAALAVAAALRMDFAQPFIGYGIGGAFLLLVAAKLHWHRIAAACSVGTIFSIFVIKGHYAGVPALFVQLLGSLGLASLLVLAGIVLWNSRDREPAAYRALLPAAVLTFLVLGAQYSLNMASLLHARTYDLYAYVFDGSLGFQPSFALGHFLKENPWLFPFVKISYEGIVLAMAAIYAAFMSRREKPLWEIIEFLFAPAMIGYLFFSIFPVCGPHYAFAVDFPNAYLPYRLLHRLALEAVPVLPAFPRNAVPSLHMTWAVMIWLNTRSLPRWMRTTAAALAIATVFDTLATGEHYLFDLIISLPFTLWMQACMVRTVSFRDRRRWMPALTGCGMFLAWLAVGRFGSHLMLVSPVIPWSLALASSAISLNWAARLPALMPEMEPQSAPSARAMYATAH